MIAANLTWDAFSQLTVVGVINGAAYGLLGVGFALILGVSGRFHFAYGFTYALAAYLVFTFAERSGIPFWLAAVLGILATAVVGVLIERVVYRPLATKAGANALLAVFVASLGLGIAGENTIRLLYSSAAQQLASAPDGLRTPINWSDSVVFRWVDVWQVVSAVVLVLALAALLRFTGLGRSIKATRVNPEMARIIGIDPNRIYLVCFFIGTLMCGVAAFWFGVKFSVARRHGLQAGHLRLRRRLPRRDGQRSGAGVRHRDLRQPHRTVEHDVARGALAAARRLRRAAAVPRGARLRPPGLAAPAAPGRRRVSQRWRSGSTTAGSPSSSSSSPSR